MFTRLQAVLAIASLFFPVLSIAQVGAKEGVIVAIIRGRVTYPNGAAVEAADVRLLPSSGGVSQQVQTDKSGKFEFPNVSPTRYTVVAHVFGFTDASQEFDMSIMSSAYASLTVHPSSENGHAAPSGVLAVLPADMPESAKSEFNEGYNIVVSGKDLSKAIPHLVKASQEYPKYGPSFLLLGTAYARTGKIDDAIPKLQKAIELDPKSPDAYIMLGDIYNAEKKFPEAEQNLTKAVEIAPTSFEARYQLGRTYYYLQKPQDAYQQLQSALQANPRSGEAHIMMANVMLRLRNADGALKEFQEGVKLDPKGPMADSARQMIDRIQTALSAQKK